MSCRASGDIILIIVNSHLAIFLMQISLKNPFDAVHQRDLKPINLYEPTLLLLVQGICIREFLQIFFACHGHTADIIAI